MKILFWSLLLFGLAFVLHLIVWKVHLPKRQTKVMLQIYFLTLITGIFGLWTASSYFQILDAGLTIEKFSDYLHIFFFFTSLTFSYMFTYTAIECGSPSLLMVVAIAEAGSNGVSKQVFNQVINDNNFILSRIEYLILDKMIYVSEQGYRLTPKGIFLARLCIFYRKVLYVRSKNTG